MRCDVGIRPKPARRQRSLIWSADPLAIRTSLATLLALCQVRRSVIDPVSENLAQIVLDLSLGACWDPVEVAVDGEPVAGERVKLDDAWVILVDQGDQWLYAHAWGLSSEGLELVALDSLEGYS